MTIQCSVYIATSLDGFIARNNGDLDWLPGADGTSDGEDYGYDAFFASIDTLVIGRKTYELASTFEQWPYGSKNVYVLSSGFAQTPQELRSGVKGTSLAPRDLVAELAAAGASHVYVDGGRTIQSFLREHLIHDITITRIPVLIGGGIPLFGSLDRDVELEHLSTRLFASGFVQSRYRVRGVS